MDDSNETTRPNDSPSVEDRTSQQRPNGATDSAAPPAGEVTDPAGESIHPALIPGLGVEQTNRAFRTDRVVFGVALGFAVAFIAWGVLGGDSLSNTASAALAWVVEYMGFFFTTLATVILIFMLYVGFGRYGRIRLGRDDEEPEYKVFSWISMLFAAGMGIGLVFWGAAEPLTFFESPPPGTVEAGTLEAMQTAQVQVLYHWGPQAWSFYALVGGAIAYGAYRKGRTPLISSIFAPLLGEQRTSGGIGKVIDIFAIIVTLFGTAASLGLGALQIGRGIELVTGLGDLGNGVLIAVIAVLTAAFIASAVSGVSKGIKALSNINSVMAILLAFFVFFVGPSMLILNVIPSVAAHFIGDLPALIGRSGAQGAETQSFLSAWTIFYWAWWISWSPFVGMFIAKISRGRTLRQFVSVVVLVPSAVSFIWFAIFGTTAIDQQMNGAGLEVSPPENVLFGVLGNLPLAGVTTVVLGILVAIFFVTGADSASLVMGTLSQQGRPDPSRWITVLWGTLVGAIAAVLLATGDGSGAGLTALQNATIVAALPFGVIMAAMMVAFLKDLRRDPLILRDAYAERAVRHSVRTGLEEYGDDFALVPSEYDHSKDDLAWVEPNVDEEFGKAYTTSETGILPIITADGTPAATPDATRTEPSAPDTAIPDRATWAPAGFGGDSPGAGPGSNPVREAPDAPRRPRSGGSAS